MWVQLNSIQQVEQNGRLTQCLPGMWVDVSKQQAIGWITNGDASRPDDPDLAALPGCGLIVKGDMAVEFKGLDLTRANAPDLLYDRTLFWNTACPFNRHHIVSGFKFLERWEIAVPLLSYTQLAVDVTPEDQKERALAVLRDLRVPLYQPGLIFMRRCANTRRLLQAWQAERENFNDPLAFLVAVYQVKPLILALPVSWVA